MVGHAPESGVPSWAVTKLRPPELRPEIEPRARLSEMIDRAVASPEPVILVSAPAGSGKSTAVALWAHTRVDVDVAWVQVEEADNDPTRFWGALLEAIGQHRPLVKTDLGPLLRAPRLDPADALVPALVNALDGTGPVAIVLDDYHLISADDVHTGVAALIEALTPDVSLVLVTRMDPPLRLGRLRVRGRLREIRAADLRFDALEAAPIFAGTAASHHDLEVLCERTEGWAAGLVLASVSLARADDPAAFVVGFAGDNRMVVDYLSSELWDTVPDNVQRLFTQISLVDAMCGPLVEALVEADPGKGASWLETAARDNQLIIALDDRGDWYRFHHLLQELLQRQLERTEPELVPVLHRRAADWLAANGYLEQAIAHALAAGADDLAADLIGGNGSKVFNEGRLVTVRGWLGALGQETVSRYPWLAVLHVWTLIVGGDLDQVDEPLAIARDLLGRGGVGSDAALLEGSLAAASALMEIAQGDVGAALAAAEKIVADPERYQQTVLVTAIHGFCLTLRGHHDRAIEPLEQAATQAPLEGEHLLAASAIIYLGVSAYETGDVATAGRYAAQGLAMAEAHSLSEYHQIGLGKSLLGRVGVGTVPDDEAVQLGERGVTLARRSHEPILIAYSLAALAEILLAVGRPDDATAALDEARELVDRCADPGIVVTLVARIEARAGRGAALRGDERGGEMVENLTERELTVLRLLPSELSVREIATELYVSHNTVKGHLKAVYRKLGVNERALAVQRARELRLF